MSTELARWILAFDGSCGTCSEVSRAVETVAGGRLSVASLQRADVVEMRQQYYGREAPWRPTLLRVVDDSIKAWTGLPMAIALSLRLGPSASVRVLHSLGEIRERVGSKRAPASSDELANEGLRRIGRKQFLRLAGGLAFAASLTVAGQTPAFASSAASKARTWAAANRDQLPQTYADFITYSDVYRRAMLANMPSVLIGKFWIEQLENYRSAASRITPRQNAVIDAGLKLVPQIYSDGAELHLSAIQSLENAALSAFGLDETRKLIAQLGPEDESSPFATTHPSIARDLPACTCSSVSDFCYTAQRCISTACETVGSGCGAFYVYACNGLCFNR